MTTHGGLTRSWIGTMTFSLAWIRARMSSMWRSSMSGWLSSGADISLPPYHLSGRGTEKLGGHTILEDAQGERLKTFGRRSARVECEGLNNDLIVIEDDFIDCLCPEPFDIPWPFAPWWLELGAW